MNKNLKKMVAIAVAFTAVSAAAPASSVNLLTTKAFAADNEDKEFDSLKLENSNGDKITLYNDDDHKSDHKLDSKEAASEDDLYAKTSANKVKIDFDGVKSKYVKIFTSDSSSAKGKDSDKEISIDGDTTLYIKIYDTAVDGKTVKYSDSDYNDIKEYKIEIDHTGNSNDDSDDSDSEADDYDDIYLETLKVGDHDISLSESKIKYSYDVDNSTDSVKITAEPDDSDYDVYIDGNSVDDSDDYKKKVSLNVGENKFEIKVKNKNDDETEKRIYTLTINRAQPAAAAAATNTAATTATTATNVTNTAATTAVKVNQWVQVGANWQFNDSLGRPIKNAWAPSNGKWYHLGWDGNMETNRWIYDANYGKYYYLYTDGSMAINTTIGGVYKVGADGAWIK